jgi:hypothetical protein
MNESWKFIELDAIAGFGTGAIRTVIHQGRHVQVSRRMY